MLRRRAWLPLRSASRVLAAAGAAVLVWAVATCLPAAAQTAPTPPPAARPVVGFGALSYGVAESDGEVTVAVVRYGTVALSAITVRFTTHDGTAQAGSDYAAVTEVVRLPVGERAVTVRVPVIDDAEVEAEEKFSVHLSDPEGATVDEGRARAAIAIYDGDAEAVNAAPSPGARSGPGDRRVVERRVVTSTEEATAPPESVARSAVLELEQQAPGVVASEDPGPVAALAVVAALLLSRSAAQVWFFWRRGAPTPSLVHGR